MLLSFQSDLYTITYYVYVHFISHTYVAIQKNMMYAMICYKNGLWFTKPTYRQGKYEPLKGIFLMKSK